MFDPGHLSEGRGLLYVGSVNPSSIPTVDQPLGPGPITRWRTLKRQEGQGRDGELRVMKAGAACTQLLKTHSCNHM